MHSDDEPLSYDEMISYGIDQGYIRSAADLKHPPVQVTRENLEETDPDWRDHFESIEEACEFYTRYL